MIPQGGRLKILLCAFPFVPVGPDAVGGAEQILSLLDRHLVRSGHCVFVTAAAGSRTSGVLLPTSVPEGVLTPEQKELVYERYRRSIASALKRFSPDLVHLHGLDFLEYLPGPGVPVLVSLHLPPSWYPGAALRLKRPSTFFTCVSRTQQAFCPPLDNFLAVVENGVEMDAYTYRTEKDGYALCLGRICPEKNFHEAFDAGRAAGVPVLLGGRVFPYEVHENYYRTEIVPRLDGRRVFLGPLGFERKRELLSRARCLLVPSLAPETSSLVAMEALASGTPVIAYPSGALAGIVEDGVTGFLVSSVEAMAEAIRKADSIDPSECRRAALRRFSSWRMASDYLSRYREVCRRARCGPGEPPDSCSGEIGCPA